MGIAFPLPVNRRAIAYGKCETLLYAYLSPFKGRGRRKAAGEGFLPAVDDPLIRAGGA